MQLYLAEYINEMLIRICKYPAGVAIALRTGYDFCLLHSLIT